ncbi:MAG: MATE family efflux transporter [Myxococcota bacterium]
MATSSLSLRQRWQLYVLRRPPTPEEQAEADLVKACRREVLAFSWPVMTELLLMSCISIINLMLVGRLGPEAISIVGLSNQPLLIFMAMFQAFTVGATALVSRAIGAGERAQAQSIAVQTVLLSSVISLSIAGLGIFGAEQIMRGMGAHDTLLHEGTPYMMYMAVGFAFQGLPTSVAAILRGAGETAAPMRYNVLSNVVHVGLGFLLIQGVPGWKGLGLQGAAIASVVARAVAYVLAVRALLSPLLPFGLEARTPVYWDRPILNRIARVGVSAAGEQLFSRLGLLLYTRIVAELGTVAVAAHQINLTVSSLALNAVTALSAAASSFVGRSLGKQAPDEGARYWREALFQGHLVSVLLTLLFFFAGVPLSALFTDSKEVIVLSAMVLKINAIISLPQSVFTVVAGGLRGAGDTRYPMMAAAVGSLGVRVSLACVFVLWLELGLLGAWYAALLDQMIRAILIHRRYKTGRWRTQTV